MPDNSFCSPRTNFNMFELILRNRKMFQNLYEYVIKTKKEI